MGGMIDSETHPPLPHEREPDYCELPLRVRAVRDRFDSGNTDHDMYVAMLNLACRLARELEPDYNEAMD